MRKNKGFTLIELVVAFAILGIASLAIGGFFVSSARSYKSVKSETALQYEAQLTLNQVEAMLIDSTLGVSYNYVNNENTPSTYRFVECDADATGEAQSKVLYAFNRNENGANYEALLLKWVAADESIYYKEYVQPQSNDATVRSIPIAGNKVEDGWELLANGITAFSVDLSGYKTNKKIDIVFSVEKQGKEYDNEGTITLRNDVLINEDSIKKIYENVNRIVKSTIESVELYARPQITIPGGTVQLTTRVNGEGYPSQEISQWLLSSTQEMDAIIQQSVTGTFVNPDTKVLKISDTFNVGETDATLREMVYVQALVDTGKLDEDGNPIYVKSAPVGISIMTLNSMSVTPSADLTLYENIDLRSDTDTSTIKTWPAAVLNEEMPEAIEVNAGNIIKMTETISGSDSLPKDVIWSIVPDEGNKATATISTDGLLVINQYSQAGSFKVRATLEFERTVFVEYPVKVGTTSIDASQLEIKTDKGTLNRGGEVNCSIYFKGSEANVKDYNWSIEVTNALGQVISDSLVTIDENGHIVADEELSYDYRYKVKITAALKTNPSNYTYKEIIIPKVTVTLDPSIAFSNIGGTVDGILCKASGLETYTVIWTMARETNPTYYASSHGNTNVTGYEEKNTDGSIAHKAKVKIGSDEPSSLTYVRVKATLAGNANYSATMKVNTKSEGIMIVGDTEMLRGETIQLSAKTKTSNSTIANTDLAWSIVSVKRGTYNASNWGDNVEISNGALYVGADYSRDYDLTITVKADWADEALRGTSTSATHTVSIAKLNSSGGGSQPDIGDDSDDDSNDDTMYEAINVSPEKILIPNGYSSMASFQAQGTTGVTWSVTNSNYVTEKNEYRGWYYVTANAPKSSSLSTSLTVKAVKGDAYGTAELRLGFEDPKVQNYGNENNNGRVDKNATRKTVYRIADSSYDASYNNRTYSLSYVVTTEQTRNSRYSSWKDVAGSETYYARLGQSRNYIWFKLNSNGTWEITTNPLEGSR